MSAAILLAKKSRTARLLAIAHGLGALARGGSQVALMIIAYSRSHSGWVVSAVLAADLVPAMALGPMLGALSDRLPRQRLLIVADGLSAAAFLGLAGTRGTPSLIAFAALAGGASTLGGPAAFSYMADLFEDVRTLETMNSLYAAVTEGALMLGTAAAGIAFAVMPAESVLAVTAGAFVASAAVLARMPKVAAPVAREPAGGFAAEVLTGLRDCLSNRRLRRALIAAATASLFLALVNVGEVFFARDALGGSATAYGLLVGAFGVGVVGGSLLGGNGGDPERGFQVALLIAATGLVGSALAPHVAVALATFAVSGVSSGLLIVHGRMLVQHAVDDDLRGRAFGVREFLMSWAFAGAFVIAPVLISLVGPRGLFFVAGLGALVVATATAATARGPATPSVHLRLAKEV